MEQAQASTTRLPRQLRLSAGERRVILGMIGTLLALHVFGWGLLFALVIPGHYGTPAAPVGVGIGITAYALGMRHAFDVDHLAAIDNVSRQLTRSGNDRPVSVGFFFSLGHSTVVFALAIVLALGLRSVVAPILGAESVLRQDSSILGNAVSGFFLLIVALINIRALVAFCQRRESIADEAGSTPELQIGGGLITRALRSPLRMVNRPRHMYPIGFLFGLGFDTATEIGLLVIAVTSIAVGVPWFGVLCLPILFAAGMVLFDTLDGIFVSFAYVWALEASSRKRRYNVVVTVVSVAVALGVGVVEIATAVAQGLSLR